MLASNLILKMKQPLAKVIFVMMLASSSSAQAVTADGTLEVELYNSQLKLFESNDGLGGVIPYAWYVEEVFDSSFTASLTNCPGTISGGIDCPDLVPGREPLEPDPVRLTLSVNAYNISGPANSLVRQILPSTYDSDSQPSSSDGKSGGVVAFTGIVRFASNDYATSTARLSMSDWTLYQNGGQWYINSHDAGFVNYHAFEVILNGAPTQKNGRLSLEGDLKYGASSDWAGPNFWNGTAESLNRVIGHIKLVPKLPIVTGISPAAVYTNSQTTFIISGSNFNEDTDFGLNNATCSAKRFISETRLEMDCTATSAGSLQYFVTDASSGGSGAIQANDLPMVTGIAPSNALIDTPTQFVISGSNFNAQTSYEISGASCSNKSFSSTTLSMTCSASQAGSLNYIVRVVNGGDLAQGNAQGSVTFSLPKPSVSGINPASTLVNTLTDFEISGANFTQGMDFGISGATCSDKTITAGRLSMKCTASTAGTLQYVVKLNAGGSDADGNARGNVNFVEAAVKPIVSNFTPLIAPLNVPTVFEITGQNFTAQTDIQLSNAQCSNKIVGASSIKLTCSASTSGEHIYSVNASSGGEAAQGNATGSVQFVNPRVTSISPSQSPINVSTQFVIEGSGFSPQTDFGITNANCEQKTWVSDSRMTVVCSSSTATKLKYFVKASSNGVDAAGLSSGDIEFIASSSDAVTVASVTPLQALLNTPSEISILGGNFTAQTVFKLDNSNCSKQSQSPTKIVMTCSATTQGEHAYAILVKEGGNLAGGESASGVIEFGLPSALTPTLSVKPKAFVPAGTAVQLEFDQQANTDYSLCYGPGTGNYSGGCFKVSSPFELIMPEGADVYGALKAVANGVESAFSNEIHLKAVQEVAVYDEQSGILLINAVTDGQQSYLARMESIGSDQYRLQLPLGESVDTGDVKAEYDPTTGKLYLPRVKAYGKYYAVYMLNMGNFVFKLDTDNTHLIQ